LNKGCIDIDMHVHVSQLIPQSAAQDDAVEKKSGPHRKAKPSESFPRGSPVFRMAIRVEGDHPNNQEEDSSKQREQKLKDEDVALSKVCEQHKRKDDGKANGDPNPQEVLKTKEQSSALVSVVREADYRHQQSNKNTFE